MALSRELVTALSNYKVDANQSPPLTIACTSTKNGDQYLESSEPQVARESVQTEVAKFEAEEQEAKLESERRKNLRAQIHILVKGAEISNLIKLISFSNNPKDIEYINHGIDEWLQESIRRNSAEFFDISGVDRDLVYKNLLAAYARLIKFEISNRNHEELVEICGRLRLLNLVMTEEHRATISTIVQPIKAYYLQIFSDLSLAPWQRLAFSEDIKKISFFASDPDLSQHAQIQHDAEQERLSAFVQKLQSDCPRDKTDSILKLLEYKYQPRDENAVKAEIALWVEESLQNSLNAILKNIALLEVQKHNALAVYTREKMEEVWKRKFQKLYAQKEKNIASLQKINMNLTNLYMDYSDLTVKPQRTLWVNKMVCEYRRILSLPMPRSDKEIILENLALESKLNNSLAKAVLSLEFATDAMQYAQQSNLVAIYARAKQSTTTHPQQALSLYYCFLVGLTGIDKQQLLDKYDSMTDEFANWRKEAETYLQTWAKTEGKKTKYFADAQLYCLLPAWLQSKKFSIQESQVFALSAALFEVVSAATQVQQCKENFKAHVAGGVGFPIHNYLLNAAQVREGIEWRVKVFGENVSAVVQALKTEKMATEEKTAVVDLPPTLPAMYPTVVASDYANSQRLFGNYEFYNGNEFSEDEGYEDEVRLLFTKVCM